MSNKVRNGLMGATLALVIAASGVVYAALTWKIDPVLTNLAYGPTTYTYELTGEASGQGNTRMLATITISGLADYTCQNKGGNQVAAQSPAQLSSTGSENVTSDHNGRSNVDLTVSLVIPATVPGKEVGCPNGNWLGVNPTNVRDVSATGQVTFGNATVAECASITTGTETCAH